MLQVNRRTHLDLGSRTKRGILFGRGSMVLTPALEQLPL